MVHVEAYNVATYCLEDDGLGPVLKLICPGSISDRGVEHGYSHHLRSMHSPWVNLQRMFWQELAWVCLRCMQVLG